MRLDRDRADAMVEQLRMLAQPQRLMILATLLRGERAVGEIEALAGIGQPALSQQLAELRRADLVTPRREARQIFYSIAGDDVATRVRALFVAFGVPVPERDASEPPIGARRGAAVAGAAAFARIGP